MKISLESWPFATISMLSMTLALAGCAGPPALQRAVIGYDETTAKLEQQLLLLNIARMRAGEPIHFTTTSSIAATFDWTTSIGATGELQESAGTNFFNLNFGTRASENPTFSIIPVSGEEFTKRILTPFKEDDFNFAVFWGARLQQALRILAEGIEVQNPDGTFVRVIDNDPMRPQQYEEFRRIVAHLQWLHDNQQLYVRRLTFDETLFDNFTGQPRSQDVVEGFDKGYSWRQKADGSYTLQRFTFGRVIVTNYDPWKLSRWQLFELNEHIKRNPKNFVYLHIHPDEPGGNFPIEGAIKLRSLIQILDFVATSIGDAPEYDVEKDPRTGQIDASPPITLQINVTDSPPAANTPSMQYRDQYYSVADTPWDRTSFAILSYLFQTAVGEVRDVGIPITISK